MKADKDFSPTSPDEVRDLAFDFRHDVFPLDPSEMLTSATFTIEVASTEAGASADPAPNTRKSGSVSIANNLHGEAALAAVQRIHTCVAGNKYRVICLASTSRGQELELWAYLTCREPD